MNNKFNKIDLTYLESVAQGNNALILEMISIFRNQVDEFITGMNKYLNTREWDMLAGVAHKAKSSLAVMGMKKLSDEMKTFEIALKERRLIEDYPNIIKKFEIECNEALFELNEIEKSYKITNN